MGNTVLIVDDEVELRSALASVLKGSGYACQEAEDGECAMGVLRRDPSIGIVLIDIRMPGKQGLEVIAEIQAERGEGVEFVVMTGHGGMDEAIQAMRLGARDFLLKPFSFRQLGKALESCDAALKQREEREQSRQALEREIQDKTHQIETLVREVDGARQDTVISLAVAAEQRDNETGAHIRRIGRFTRILARGIGLPEDEQNWIGLISMLHDVGKIGVPDRILLKQGPLTPDEITLIQRHTVTGKEILIRSSDRFMQNAADIALCHHERWDGTGYPNGLAGAAIPLEARMTAIADVYDALRSPRPYKPAFDHETVLHILFEGDGRTSPDHFDPELLDVFRKHAEEFRAEYAADPDSGREAAEKQRRVYGNEGNPD